jgi:hypothetical protein
VLAGALGTVSAGAVCCSGPALDVGFAPAFASGAALAVSACVAALDAAVSGAALVPGGAWGVSVGVAALGAAVSGVALVPLVSGAGLTAPVSAAPGAAALLVALAAGLALVRGTAFARVPVVVPRDRAVGAGFDLALAVVPDREVAAAVFGLASGTGSAGRLPAAGDPEAAMATAVPSAVPGRACGPLASVLPWSRSAEAAFAARGRPAARAWLSEPAGCFSAPRLGAGPVPLPVEPSPGVPFSEVTAP